MGRHAVWSIGQRKEHWGIKDRSSDIVDAEGKKAVSRRSCSLSSFRGIFCSQPGLRCYMETGYGWFLVLSSWGAAVI